VKDLQVDFVGLAENTDDVWRFDQMHVQLLQ
jgi:hypothetical protein